MRKQLWLSQFGHRHPYEVLKNKGKKNIKAKEKILRTWKAFCTSSMSEHFKPDSPALFWEEQDVLCNIWGFQESDSLALHSKRQTLLPYCLSFLNRGNSESVACNCCSCSWCCLWLINELVDQRENLWSHWKFWPISLLYPRKALSLYLWIQHSSYKNTPWENKSKKKVLLQL